MDTTWIVRKVIATEGQTLAELERVEFFKRNPAYDAMMEEVAAVEAAEGQAAADERFAGIYHDEFIDAEPDDPDADTVKIAGTLTIDIYDGPAWKPGEILTMTLAALRG